MKWAKYSLNEIADYWSGKMDSNVLNSTNYISTENLVQDKGGIVESSYVPIIGKVNSYKEKDVLISNIRPYFKKIWFADREGGCSNDVLVFRARDIVDSLYLYYQLSKDAFFNDMVAGSNGTKMPRGNKASIMEFKFLIPPLPTQRRIASILSAYDDLIENNLKRIKLLEEKALCEYKLIAAYRKTDILGEVLKLNYGKSLSADNRKPGLYPVYGSSGVVGYNENFLVKGPGVIVGRKGNVGTVFWSPSDFFPIDTVYYVESEISLYFIYFNLKHSQHFDNSDAAVPGLNRNSALSNKIHLPSMKVIKAFEEYCKPIFNLMNVLNNQNAKLREARDILLPRLMNGEIVV